MKKPLVIVLLMLLFPTAADIASAQEQPYAGDTNQRRALSHPSHLRIVPAPSHHQPESDQNRPHSDELRMQA